MFYLKKTMSLALTISTFAVLTACNLGQAAEPTPTNVDIDAVKTSAAATAHVELTQIAASIPPTSTETVTPTETSTLAPTNTGEAGSLSATETPTSLVIDGLSTVTAIPSLTLAPVGGGSTGGASGPTCKNAAFNGDITIPDGTVFKPWEKFTKAWSVKNTGTCTWDEGFYFAGWAGPPSMTAHPYKIQYAKDFVPGGSSVNIYIAMYAPGDPGQYVAHWAMYDDNGRQFGGDFTVVIKVVK